MSLSFSRDDQETCPSVDEILVDRFIAIGRRHDVDEEDLRLLDDTMACGATGFNMVVWLRGQLHVLQQQVLHQGEDYAQHADQVQRWAKMFNHLAPHLPAAYVRFQKWSEIDSIDWELQTELETIVWSDFKCHCACLN